MKCQLLVYYRSPKTGTQLSGPPDKEQAEVPDGQYQVGDEIFLDRPDGSKRLLEVVGRRHIGGVMVPVCREHRIWEVAS